MQAELLPSYLFTICKEKQMGFLNSGDIFSKISGTVGAVVFRTSGGKTIVAHRPGAYKVSQSAAAILVRKKFGFVQAIYKALRLLPSFMQLWKSAPVKGKSVLNKFMAINNKRIADDLSPASISLSPFLKGFEILNTEVNISAGSVTISADALGPNTGIIPALETKLVAEGVLVLSTPVDSDDEAYVIVPVESTPVNMTLVDPLTFNLGISGEDSSYYSRYTEKKAVLNLVTRKADGTAVRMSETFYN